MSVGAVTDFVAVLTRHADTTPNSIACTYLGDDGRIRQELTYAELDQWARAIGARLQGLGVAGTFVPLLYPPGLDFLCAFFGCLYAGCRAIPLPVPRHARYLDQMARIISDVDARCILCTESVRSKLGPGTDGSDRSDVALWLPGDDTEIELARAWQAPEVNEGDIAYLQYTSGSTSDRKGVIVSHANLVANILSTDRGFRHTAESVVVSWLPHFHDLGLVAGMLDPLFHGCQNVLLSPASFVRQPVRWLEALTRFGGTHSSSPNFGYDHCARSVSDEQLDGLDLSRWRIALNGAEPVRSATLEAFASRFASVGFSRGAFYPAYGLAEATLVVSGGVDGRHPREVRVDRSALERHEVRAAGCGAAGVTLVGCGSALEGTKILIADPESGAAAEHGRIGELWVSGPAVSRGYWADDEATRTTFVPGLEDPSTTYLRTGDLGFVDDDGEVFITGRLKDVIIIRGTNHYPQDIEWSVERSDPALRPGCGAAFSVDEGGEERLVVVFELRRADLRSVDSQAVTSAARRAVAEAHDVHLHQLVLLKTGSVPRTSSGKIQRGLCRKLFLEGGLAVIDSPLGTSAPPIEESGGGENPQRERPTHEEARARSLDERGRAHDTHDSLNSWLRDYAETRLNSQLADVRRSIAPHVVLDFGNQGVLGLQTPTALGGLEFTDRAAMAVYEQLGSIDLTLAMMVIVHNTLGIRPILQHATGGLRDDLVPGLATGRELAAFAITEPGAGSNPQAIAGTAISMNGGGWRLDGEKIWSGTAGWASVVNVFVQNVGADGVPRGTTGFAVPREAAGFRVGAEAMTLGMRGMVQNAISLDGVRVDSTRVLGEVGRGMDVAHDAMMHGRLCIAAACVGGMKRCLHLLHRYAAGRRVSTGLLIDNPVLRDRISVLVAAASAISSLVERVAGLLDEQHEVPIEAYVACKTSAPEWLWRAADDLVQFLGGRGYIESNVAPQLLRDARVARILEGPTETLNMFMGSRVTNDPESFDRLVGEIFGARDLCNRVGAAVAEINERSGARTRTSGARVDSVRWAHAQCGEVATAAVLLAAAEAGDDARPGAELARAWARREFERTLSEARAACAVEEWPPSAADVAALVGAFADPLGDIEQTAAGEEHGLDPLLRRGGESARDGAAAEHRMDAPGARAPGGPVSEGLPDEEPLPGVMASTIDGGQTAEQILAFIVDWLARELKMPRDAVRPDGTFLDCGIDSVTSVMLVVSLEELLGRELPAELTSDVPRIRDLAERLASGQV